MLSTAPVLRAFLVKGAALAAAVGAWAALPPAPGAVAVAAILLATVAFFTYTIAHPSSHYFVPVVDRATTRRKVVALTFDDGPDPDATGKVLDLLAAHGARATFFVIGERAAAHPELIRRMHAEGHTIGTHTQHHRLRFHFGGAAYVRREIEEAIDVVAGIVPERPSLFRPPQGLRTPLFARAFRATPGLQCVTWTARGLDGRPTTAGAIVERITRGLTPGAILALHDGGSIDRAATLEALPRILERCRERGLACVPLEELRREGALPAGPSALDAERFPYKAFLPGFLYWPYRAWRTVAVASCFAAFWGGSVLFSWITLPIMALWPGTREARMHRAQKALRLCFHAFHFMMRALWLYRPSSPSKAARPGGAPADRPAVLVANHPTLCDVTSIVSLFPGVVGVARPGYATNPFMGRLIRMCGFVPAGMHMLEECQARLKMGFDVLVFPEGTRSPFGGGLQPFHRGAFELAARAGVPLVLLKLTCRPPALAKRLPIWKHADRCSELRVEPVATILPEEMGGDSKSLCRAVERRYLELLEEQPK